MASKNYTQIALTTWKTCVATHSVFRRAHVHVCHCINWVLWFLHLSCMSWARWPLGLPPNSTILWTLSVPAGQLSVRTCFLWSFQLPLSWKNHKNEIHSRYQYTHNTRRAVVGLCLLTQNALLHLRQASTYFQADLTVPFRKWKRPIRTTVLRVSQSYLSVQTWLHKTSFVLEVIQRWFFEVASSIP